MSYKPERLKADLEAAGELHAIVEEHDAELELRLGQVAFDKDANGDYTGVFVVTSHGETHTFHCDRVVSYYMPEEIFH